MKACTVACSPWPARPKPCAAIQDEKLKKAAKLIKELLKRRLSPDRLLPLHPDGRVPRHRN